MTMPAAEWILREPDAVLLETLSQCADGVSLLPLTRRLLALRGVGAGEAASFLNPKLSALSDPFELPGMNAAAERILAAVDRRERVILYGDYDVDGVSSIALMTIILRAYGAEPKTFLPHRMEEGYGLSSEGIARCFEEHGRPGLLVALDCGTASVVEAHWLRGQGVDLIIVDHHEPGASLPDCVALVNPKAGGSGVQFCTAGLAFKLMHALLKLRKIEGFDLREHLDLAALGTVADLVPLRDENRIMVQKGLLKLGSTGRCGLRALKDVCGIDGHVQAQHIGFRLGPRLNASGRLDHAQASLDLILSEDAEEAAAAASLLNVLNRERQEVENDAHREALEMIAANPELAQASCIVIGSRNWHQGVVGIVASRIMRDFHRPTVVIAFDENGSGKGSGRSVPGVSLVDALDTCRHLLIKGGGHAMAAGVSLEESNLEPFRAAMTAAVEQQIEAHLLRPCVELDAECELADFQNRFFDQFLQLEPFGMGNAEPMFLIRNVRPSLPGQVLKEKHWKLRLQQNGTAFPAIWFNAPLDSTPDGPWDVAAKLQRQFWRGAESWSLMIHAVRPASEDISRL